MNLDRIAKGVHRRGYVLACQVVDQRASLHVLCISDTMHTIFFSRLKLRPKGSKTALNALP